MGCCAHGPAQSLGPVKRGHLQNKTGPRSEWDQLTSELRLHLSPCQTPNLSACTDIPYLPTVTRFLPAQATFPFLALFSLSSLGPEFLFPVHPPSGQGVGRPPAPWSGWGLSHHPHPFLSPAEGPRRATSRRASLCPAYPTLAHQDVNLKVPRNSQLLHFAFREDKQWKLQQVTGPFPDQGSGHTGRQGQAVSAEASRCWRFVSAASPGGWCFLAAKLEHAVPRAPEHRLLGSGEPGLSVGTTGSSPTGHPLPRAPRGFPQLLGMKPRLPTSSCVTRPLPVPPLITGHQLVSTSRPLPRLLSLPGVLSLAFLSTQWCSRVVSLGSPPPLLGHTFCSLR